jgi:hypothetical protein
MIETSFRTLLLLKKKGSEFFESMEVKEAFFFFLPDYSPPITKQNDIKDAFIFLKQKRIMQKLVLIRSDFR